MNQNKLHQIGNTAGLLMVCVILTIAFGDQVYRHDMPCPLCLLQRTGFVAIGLCLCMNLKNGIKTTHYGLMTLAALLGFATSIRQVFLHLAPGDPGYGHLLFGFDLYIWSVTAFTIVIVLIAIAMLFEHGFTQSQQKPGRTIRAIIILFLVLILANLISTFVECGISACPDNPVGYTLLG